MMAHGCGVLMCLLSVLSAMLRNGHCQYQQIDLTSNSVTCNMSTVYTGQPDGDSLGCVGAIDGVTDTHWRPTRDPNPNCIFTQIYSYPAYWFLDLQQEHNIHKITVYYVTRPPYYTEYLRNVRVTADGNEIFKYPASSIRNPEHITNNLPVKARIIKIERTYAYFRNYLPLCEVQLWECETNRYGNQCAMKCSLNCQKNTGPRTCDAFNGTCLNGCKPDGKFNSSLCTDCRAGHWGDECNMLCNRGCQNNNCSRDNGQCTCKPGWQQPDCDVCDSSHYGLDCTETCGHCTGEANCHNVTGHCPSCKPGWKPPRCKDECSGRTYGQNCRSPCGHCADNATCDTVTGRCPPGCGPGYLGQGCDEACSHFSYGNNCSEACGNCVNKTTCHHVTGSCAEGCVDGFKSDKCTTCIAHRWGGNCNESCGNCADDGSCLMGSGECPHGCREGWNGTLCMQQVFIDVTPYGDVDSVVGGVVGGVVAALVVAVVVAAIVFLRRRRKKATGTEARNKGDDFHPYNSISQRGNNSTKEMTDEIPADTPSAENIYDPVDTYVNPDDMNVYTALKTTAGRGLFNISGRKVLVAEGNDEGKTADALYQNVPMRQ